MRYYTDTADNGSLRRDWTALLATRIGSAIRNSSSGCPRYATKRAVETASESAALPRVSPSELCADAKSFDVAVPLERAAAISTSLRSVETRRGFTTEDTTPSSPQLDVSFRTVRKGDARRKHDPMRAPCRVSENLNTCAKRPMIPASPIKEERSWTRWGSSWLQYNSY